MKTDVTNKTTRGKVNIRYNEKRDTYRYRFTPIHEDQHEIIQLALAKCRDESGTEYDSVALTNICLHYISFS